MDAQQEETPAEKSIDLSVLSWAEANTGVAFSEYIMGGGVEDIRSGERPPTDRQAEVMATLSALRRVMPNELEDESVTEVVRGWLTQVGREGKAIARFLHEHAMDSQDEIPTRDDLEAILATLALDSYPAFLFPPDSLPFPMMDPLRHHVTSLLHRHPHATAFFEAALRDPVLKVVFKEEREHSGRVANVFRNTSAGGWVHLAMLPDMVLQAAWRHLEGASLSPTTFAAKTIQQFRLVRDVLAGKSRKIPVKIAFTGVLLPSDSRFEIPAGIVRPVTEADRSLAPASLKTQLSSTDSSGKSVIINYDGNVLLEYNFPYKTRVSPLVSEGVPDWPKDMRPPAALDQAVMRLRFSLSLALQRETRVQIVPTWRHYDDPLATGTALMWSDPRQSPGLVPTQLTEAEVRAWHEWYGRLDTPHIKNIELALNRIMRAMAERREPSDVLIDSVIAWENLFGGGGESTLRVSACLAKLLEGSPEKRTELKTHLADIYVLRSRVVHGNTTLQEKHHPDCYQALDVAIQAVRVLTTTRTDLLAVPKAAARSERLLLRT